MAVSRNDLCPCGSGMKYKKCCLGAPDPKAEKKKNILLYGSLGLLAVTAAVFFIAGPGVGAATGLAAFGLVIGYALAGSGASPDPEAAKAAKGPGKKRAGKQAKAGRTAGARG